MRISKKSTRVTIRSLPGPELVTRNSYAHPTLNEAVTIRKVSKPYERVKFMNEMQIELRATEMANSEQILSASKILEETPICDREAVLGKAVIIANENAEKTSQSSRYLTNVEITKDEKTIELFLARPTFFGLGKTETLPLLKTTLPLEECKK